MINGHDAGIVLKLKRYKDKQMEKNAHLDKVTNMTDCQRPILLPIFK
jgi:hypothetical protein